MRALILICLFSLFFSLTACGQKGPLYMPEKPESSEQP
ncbi:MAG: LPS translocon maturation chaperone LptM [Porticoccaceae bacterium]